MSGDLSMTCPTCHSFRGMAPCELCALRAEVARLTAEVAGKGANLAAMATQVAALMRDNASQAAEYATALAFYTDTVRDLTAEADAAREEAVEACVQSAADVLGTRGQVFDDVTFRESHCVAAIRATPHSTALRDRVKELEAQMEPWRIDGQKLADEVDLLVRRHVIDARSPAADALLDFRNPPMSPRSDRLLALESALAAETAAHAATREERRVDAMQIEHLKTLVNQPGWDALRARAERAEAQLAAMREALADAESKLGSAAHVAGEYVTADRTVAETNWRPLRDRLREAHAKVLAALSASAPTEPRADLKCGECNSTRLVRFSSWRCEACGFSDSEVTK